MSMTLTNPLVILILERNRGVMNVMAELIIMLAATFIGVVAATLIPYFRKLWEKKIEKFDWKYVFHLITTAIWTFAASIVVYASWTPSSDFIAYDIIVYVLAFAFGYGGNGLQKDLEKFIRFLQTLSKGVVVADP